MSDFEARYEFLHPLGQPGGFGAVYKAKDRVLDDIVAIKILNAQWRTEPQIAAMFRDEAILTRKLKHANVVQVLEYDEEHFAIVMEYIRGVTLSHFIKVHQQQKSYIPERLGLYILGEVCLALHHAHFAEEEDARGNRRPLNIIHRDVSPSNIMITVGGGIKMIDFGIAKAEFQARRSGRTRTGVVKGKPYYLSPEHGNPSKMDHRSDIFPLGAVLYEVLTGQKLFDNVYSTVLDMKEVVIPQEKFESNHLRWEIERIIRKAAEHDLERRYQSAADMYKDIEDDLLRVAAKPAELQRQLGELMHNFPLEPSDGSEPLTPPTQESHHIVDLPPTPVVITPSDVPATEVIAAPSVRTPNGKSGKRAKADMAQGFKRFSAVLQKIRLPKFSLKAVIALPLTLAVAGVVWFFFLSTPTLTITSLPAPAQVFLNGEPVPGATPMKIKKFKAGAHQLRLVTPGFEDLNTTITLADSNASAAFHFTFQARFRVNANLPNTLVLLNRQPLQNRTPMEFRWEVDKEFELALVQTGLDTLHGFRYRWSNQQRKAMPEISNAESWQLNGLTKVGSDWQLEGRFHKTIRVKSLPPGAEVFVDGDFSKPAGIADQDEITLSAGRHQITLRSSLKDIVDRSHRIMVDGLLKRELTLPLYRRVRFVAIPEAARAEIVNISANTSGIDSVYYPTARGTRQRLAIKEQVQFSTFIPLPTELLLSAATQKILIAARGYLDKEITLPPERTGEVTVNLQKFTAPGLEIYVYDAKSKAPLFSSKVSYCQFQKSSDECLTVYGFNGQPFGKLASYGHHAHSLPEGNYRFKVECEGYQAVIRSEKIFASLKQIRVGLTPLR